MVGGRGRGVVRGHPEVSAGQRAGPPLLVAAVMGSASQFSFVSHPSVSSTVGCLNVTA